MHSIFLKVFNISLTAGWLVLAAVLFRCVFRKAPKKLRCLVWAIVALRLVLPFTIESPISLTPDARNIREKVIELTASSDEPVTESIRTESNMLFVSSPSDASETTFIQTQQVDFTEAEAERSEAAPKEPVTLKVLCAVWLAGVAAMMLYTAISFIALRKSISGFEVLFDNIVCSDRADTPFIFGFIKPLIVLPSSVSDEDAPFAVVHEKAHIERRDHLIKPLGFALLSVYWFNPLMWLAYILLCRDIELACDERVIVKCGCRIKKGYSEALLNCSIMERRIKACPVAFGEVGVKARVKSILDYKRSTAAVTALALIVCTAIGVFLLPTRSHGAPVESAITDELPNDRDYTRVYLLGDDCDESSQMRIMFSSSDSRYVIIADNGDGPSVIEEGSFISSDYKHLRLTSDSGYKHVLCTEEDYLYVPEEELKGADDPFTPEESSELETDDPVFHRGGTWLFRLYKGNHKTTCYYYSQGTCFIWYSQARILYVFGHSDIVYRELMKLDFFNENPQIASQLKLTLENMPYPNCKFHLTDEGFICQAWLDSYESCVHVLRFSSIPKSKFGLGITISGAYYPGTIGPEATSSAPNRLTPGSLYARGGYRNH